MTKLGENSALTQIEIEIIVDKAVRQTFVTLGADLTDNRAVLSLQKDFAYMRDQRVGGEKTADFLKKGFIGVVLSGFLWALWQGIKAALQAKGAL